MHLLYTLACTVFIVCLIAAETIAIETPEYLLSSSRNVDTPSVNIRDPPQCDKNNQSRYTSLVCWLYDLELAIPDERIRKGLISIRIHDMTCSQFQMNSTESKYIPGTDTDENAIFVNSTDPKLDVKVHGISIQCRGRYKAALAGGTVTVLVDNIGDEALHIQTAIKSTFLTGDDDAQDESSIRAPSGANVTVCSTNLQVPKDGGISFSGSISAKFVELFSQAIASKVTSELNSQICPQVKNVVDRNLTDALLKLDSFLGHLIYDEPQDLLIGASGLEMDVDEGLYNGNGYTNDADLLQWDELSVLKFVLEQMSDFVNAHLDKGILLDLLDRIGWPISNDQSCKDCGYLFRGVNGLVKNFTDDGQLTIEIEREFNFGVQNVGDVSIILRNATIGGLDELIRFGIFPAVPRDITPQIMMKYLALDIDADLKIFPTPGGIIHGNPLEESFSTFLNASHILLDLAIDLGITRDKIRNITIADLNDPLHRRRRLLKSVSHVILGKVESAITVETIRIDPLKTSDTLEKSLDVMLNNIIILTLREYEEIVSKTIEAALSGPVLEAINDALAKMIRNTTVWEPADPVDKDESTDFFRFNESLAILRLHDYFSSEMFVNKMNAYIACISSYLKENPLHSSPALSIGNGINALIENFSFEGVAIDGIDFLKSIDASHLEFGLDANGNSTSKNVTSVFGLDLDYPQQELHAAITMNSSLSDFGGEFGSKILFDIFEYQKINLYDLITDPASMVKPLSTSSGIYDLSAFVEKLNVGINVSLNEKGHDRQVLFESTVEDRFGSLVTGYIISSTKLMQNVLNGMKQLYVGPDSKRPYDIERGQGIAGSSSEIQWIVFVALLFICVNVYFFAKSPRKNKDDGFAIDSHPETSSSSPNKNSPIPTSLIFHTKISHIMRFLIPLAIVATIVVFMVSNFSVGAWVDIKVSRPDGSTILMIPAVTTFSLGKTVTDMYHAQVYTLMTLVLVFSGIWPYVKLLLMLVSWISPVSIMSFETKEWLLILLDALGKYSLVDSFVLVLMLVSFKFHIDFPGIGFIDSYVIPAFGFYLFLMATVLSLIIGHGVTFLHRFTKLKPTIQRSNYRQALRHHEFHFIDSIGGVRFARLSPLAHKCWALITVTCTIFLCIGATNKSFTFVFQGLLGDILGENRSASYSLWTLGMSLPLSVEDPKSFGVTIIQITFLFFALVMPFACLVTITILYYIPMTLRGQQIVFMLAEIANAWSAIEVFLLSVLASMLELSQFASFMVGDHCDFLKAKFFHDLFQNQTCFSVESNVSVGVIYLCTGVAMYNLIVFMGLRLAHNALEERMLREGDGEGSLPGNSNQESSTMISKMMRWKISSVFMNTIDQH